MKNLLSKVYVLGAIYFLFFLSLSYRTYAASISKQVSQAKPAISVPQSVAPNQTIHSVFSCRWSPQTTDELKTAINEANEDSISVSLSAICLKSNATYKLTEDHMSMAGFPEITGKVIIYGNGAIIRRFFVRGSPPTPDFRFFNIKTDATLSLSNVTLSGGNVPTTSGGAILNYGTLNLNQVTLQNNRAEYGGAIINFGTVAIKNSTLSQNTTSIAGGAIFNRDASKINCTDSLFSHNSSQSTGGAIGSDNESHLEIIRSTFEGNQSEAGGAIALYNDASLLAQQSLFIGNISELAAGTIYSNGINNSILLTNSTFTQNSGGGITQYNGYLTLQGVTISGNTSTHGAGVNVPSYDNIYATVQNSIIFGNHSSDDTGWDTGADLSGPITSAGHNILGDMGGTFIPHATDLFTDPTLGNFENDGTPGQGHFPLLAGSPAINSGDASFCESLPTDQLGTSRLLSCDIGAVESSCGNGITEASIGETCDDANMVDEDGCSRHCN